MKKKQRQTTIINKNLPPRPRFKQQNDLNFSLSSFLKDQSLSQSAKGPLVPQQQKGKDYSQKCELFNEFATVSQKIKSNEIDRYNSKGLEPPPGKMKIMQGVSYKINDEDGIAMSGSGYKQAINKMSYSEYLNNKAHS